MTHEFKSMAGRDGLSAVYVESPHLSLCHQGHDCLDYLCNCEDGAIVQWFGGVVGHEETSSCPAACLRFGEVRCVAVTHEDHVTCVVSDNCIRMSRGIVQKLLYLFHRVLGRVCLLCGDRPQCRKYCAVGTLCII